MDELGSMDMSMQLAVDYQLENIVGSYQFAVGNQSAIQNQKSAILFNSRYPAGMCISEIKTIQNFVQSEIRN